jgi:predicted XRE-type DNA-binding protein
MLALIQHFKGVKRLKLTEKEISEVVGVQKPKNSRLYKIVID